MSQKATSVRVLDLSHDALVSMCVRRRRKVAWLGERRQLGRTMMVLSCTTKLTCGDTYAFFCWYALSIVAIVVKAASGVKGVLPQCSVRPMGSRDLWKLGTQNGRLVSSPHSSFSDFGKGRRSHFQRKQGRRLQAGPVTHVKTLKLVSKRSFLLHFLLSLIFLPLQEIT